MLSKLKVFSENQYNAILQEVGAFRYVIYDKGETVPGNVFRGILDAEHYNCVVAGTGDTTDLCTLKLPDQETVIPKNSSVIVVRFLRFDNTHGEPHYNADDQIIFPTMKGEIFRLPRKDVPDHYIRIAEEAHLVSVAEAYRLPVQKSGPIVEYSARGARLHVDLIHH